MYQLIALLLARFGMRAYLRTVPKQKQRRGLDRLMGDITNG